MRGQILITAAACLLFTAASGGEGGLLPEMRQHLSLARKTGQHGSADAALAHASVVAPDRKIRLRVDCAGLPARSQGIYRNALFGAIGMWNDALGETTFEVTETGKADVVIRFQPAVRTNGVEVSGHARWTRGVLRPDTNPKVILTAEVRIRTFKPNAEPMDFNQLRACAAHELGHVLGLDDSLAVGNVMGPMALDRPVLRIRADEIQVLVDARSEAQEIRRDVMYRALRMRQV